MPRYFIDVRSRFGCDEDLEGVYLSSVNAARDEALRVASSKLQGTWRNVPPDIRNDIAIEIVGEAGQTVLVLSFWDIEKHLETAKPVTDNQMTAAGTSVEERGTLEALYNRIAPSRGWGLSVSRSLMGTLLLASALSAFVAVFA